MTRERFGRRCFPVSVSVLISVCALLIGAVSAQAATAATAVAAPGSNVVSASVRSVQPAVSGLFQIRSPRVWADEIDESGKLGKNGVPDFLDTWEAFRSRTSSANLDGKSYAFTTIDGLGHEVLYAGVQRASSGGPSEVTFELNQKTGERLLGDLRIVAEIDAAGNVGTARFEGYAGEGKGGTKVLAILSGEGCNDAGTACIVSNGALLEAGVNVSQLSGEPNKRFEGIQIVTPQGSGIGTFAINPNPDTCNAATDPSCPFYSVCVKEAGGLQNPACTANDVQLTEILEGFTNVLPDKDGGIGCDGELDNDDPQCPSGLDCVTFTARGRYVITTQSRYDIGTFIAVDSDANGDGAISGQCLRYGYSLGDTTNLEPGTPDICGDLTIALAAAPNGKLVDFGPITVPCIADDDGNIVINHCETWSQRAAEIDCRGSDDVLAGTGSKCNCGVLSGICIAVNSGDGCINNVCQGECQPPSGTGGSGDTCQTNSDCDTGETCQDIELTAVPVVCSDQDDTVCDNPDTCVDGVCQPNYEPDTTSCRDADGICDVEEFCDGEGSCPEDGFQTGGECRASSCDTSSPLCCDVPESCSGTSADCPPDGFRTGECRAADGVCDVAENCTAEGTCPQDGFVPASDEQECRAAGNECDAPETCDGLSAECPADLCGEQVLRVNPFTCTPPAP